MHAEQHIARSKAETLPQNCCTAASIKLRPCSPHQKVFDAYRVFGGIMPEVVVMMAIDSGSEVHTAPVKFPWNCANFDRTRFARSSKVFDHIPTAPNLRSFFVHPKKLENAPSFLQRFSPRYHSIEAELLHFLQFFQSTSLSGFCAVKLAPCDIVALVVVLLPSFNPLTSSKLLFCPSLIFAEPLPQLVLRAVNRDIDFL